MTDPAVSFPKKLHFFLMGFVLTTLWGCSFYETSSYRSPSFEEVSKENILFFPVMFLPQMPLTPKDLKFYHHHILPVFMREINQQMIYQLQQLKGLTIEVASRDDSVFRSWENKFADSLYQTLKQQKKIFPGINLPRRDSFDADVLVICWIRSLKLEARGYSNADLTLPATSVPKRISNLFVEEKKINCFVTIEIMMINNQNQELILQQEIVDEGELELEEREIYFTGYALDLALNVVKVIAGN